MTEICLFLIVLKAGKSNTKMLADSVSGESLLPHRWRLLTVSSRGRRGQGSLWGLFYMALNPIYLLKALSPNTIISRIRISMEEFWGDINIQSMSSMYQII